jgi:hypothetical protein
MSNETTAAKITLGDNGLGFEAEAKKLLDNIVSQVGEAFADFKAIVVITAAADTDTQINFNMKNAEFSEDIKTKITTMASTRMEIDGDIYAMIPAKTTDPEIRQEVITLHRENVALATENWKKFLEGVLTIVEIGADLAGIKLPNARSRLMATISPTVAPQPALRT